MYEIMKEPSLFVIFLANMNAGNKKIYIFVYLCIVGMVLVVNIYFFSKLPKISFQHFFYYE